MRIKKQVMNSKQISATLNRLSMEIIERNTNLSNLAIVGIRTRGVPVGHRIQNLIYENQKVKLPFGILDITLYRDDLSKIGPHPLVKETEINFDVSGKDIILVDDVLFSGRTVRAALDSIIDFGRPSTIQLLVLIDRGHRELPICADHIGKKIATTKKELVKVKLKEIDGEDKILIAEEGD